MFYTEPESTKSKGKKPKAGKENSEFCYDITFKKAYQFPYKKFRYWNDPPFGNKSLDHQLEALRRRVLEGSCKGRYTLAQLKDKSGKVLEEYSFVDDTIINPELKMYVVCHPKTAAWLQSVGYRHPLITDGNDVDLKTGAIGIDAQLVNFRRILTHERMREGVKVALVYRQSDNKRVAQFDSLAHLSFLDRDFGMEVLSKGNFKAFELGYFH